MMVVASNSARTLPLVLSLVLAIMSTVLQQADAAGKFNPVEKLFQPLKQPNAMTNNDKQNRQESQQQQQRELLLDNNTVDQQSQTQTQTSPKTTFIPPRVDPFAPTPEEREAERLARRERQRQRHAKVQEAMKKAKPETAERLSDEELESLQKDHPEFRKLWGGSSGNSHAIQYADPGDDYDMWQQAYRMLGGFIDCDHYKSQGSHDNNQEGEGQNNNNNNNGNGPCSRWMMWASVSNSGNVGDNTKNK
jgi:hypothetical protein